MTTLPPSGIGKEGRRALPVKIISSPQEMDEFEKEEMKKGRPVVKNRLNERYDWLVDYIPKPIKNAVSKASSRAKNSILGLYDVARKTLKDIVEKEAKQEQQQEEDLDLIPPQHERVLKGAYRSFVRPGVPKTDIDSYFNQTKPQIKTLIENQLKEMGPAKMIMTLWVIWKKRITPLIALDPADAKKRMLAYIKAQTENLKFPQSGFTLDKIMHLYINLHRLVLIRGRSYIELPEEIKSKKAVINPAKQG